MADTREVRAFATEIKFVVDAAVAADVRRWARAHLEPDPHGAGEAGDQYPDDERVLRHRATRRLSSPRLFRSKQVSHPALWLRPGRLPRTEASRAGGSGKTPDDGAAGGAPSSDGNRSKDIMVRRLVPRTSGCTAAPAGMSGLLPSHSADRTAGGASSDSRSTTGWRRSHRPALISTTDRALPPWMAARFSS